MAVLVSCTCSAENMMRPPWNAMELSELKCCTQSEPPTDDAEELNDVS